MKFIDCHAHTNFAVFDEDRASVLKRAEEKETYVINVGTQRDTSEKAVAITKDFPNGVYAIIGLHPIHTGKSYHDKEELGEGGKEFTSRGEVFDLEVYQKMIDSCDKVVGIGECGLDYYRVDKDMKSLQERAFRLQIELAIKNKLPLMLHMRCSPDSMDAYEDAIAILDEYTFENPGNSHFFAGNIDIAKQFLDRGFSLSFTGVITFAKQYEELVKYVPLEMILSETDCPFVSPVPYRGKRCEPIYVSEVVSRIAEIKGLPLEKVREQLVLNARRIFTKIE